MAQSIPRVPIPPGIFSWNGCKCPTVGPGGSNKTPTVGLRRKLTSSLLILAQLWNIEIGNDINRFWKNWQMPNARKHVFCDFPNARPVMKLTRKLPVQVIYSRQPLWKVSIFLRKSTFEQKTTKSDHKMPNWVKKKSAKEDFVVVVFWKRDAVFFWGYGKGTICQS